MTPPRRNDCAGDSRRVRRRICREALASSLQDTSSTSVTVPEWRYGQLVAEFLKEKRSLVMRLNITVMVYILAVFGSCRVLAGPPDGEMFGYRLMDKYPVSENTKWVNMHNLIAENAAVPKSFSTVTLAVTPETYTVWAIAGEVKAHSEAESETIGRKYFALFEDMYSSKCKVRSYSSGKGGEFVCADKYVISLEWLWLTFRVQLMYLSESPEQQLISNILDKEEGALKKRRLNDAKTKGELRGLQ